MSIWMNTEHLDDERIVEIVDIAMKSELNSISNTRKTYSYYRVSILD